MFPATFLGSQRQWLNKKEMSVARQKKKPFLQLKTRTEKNRMNVSGRAETVIKSFGGLEGGSVARLLHRKLPSWVQFLLQ